jgi:hypothetical protein
MTDWYSKNLSAIKGDGLLAPLSISSWAIVMDLQWKTAFTAVRTTDSTDDNKVPNGSSLANSNYNPVGTIGDHIGVYLSVKNQTYV